MKYKHILIVTYGRSGSTLLQGLLNSIDGCLIRGENYNACHGIFMAFKAFSKARKEFGRGQVSLSPTTPWYGASLIDEEKFLDDARTLLIRQLAPPEMSDDYSCIGFKEIRYLPTNLGKFSSSHLREYLDFLTRLLPQCALIFLTRDNDQVVNSAWWKSKQPEKVKQRLASFEQELSSYAQDKSWVFQMDYLDMTKKTNRLRALYEFLEVPYVEEEIDKVLSVKHSYSPKPGKFTRPVSLRLDVKRLESIVHVSFDRFKNKTRVDVGNPFSIRGVILLAVDASPRCRLVARTPAGERDVKWGIKSMMLAEKYPESPHSNNARFMLDNVSLVGGETIEFYLLDETGGDYHIATISIMDGTGQ